MEETRICSPNVGADHTLTSNLCLDALGPGNATEVTEPSEVYLRRDSYRCLLKTALVVDSNLNFR